jgi:hypothetical protein
MLPPPSTSTTRRSFRSESAPARKRGERRRAGALDDALLELDQPQDRERDARLIDGDHLIDDLAQHRERLRADDRHRKPVGKPSGASGGGHRMARGRALP